MKPEHYPLAIMLGLVLFVGIPCWISTIRLRRAEREDSLQRLTPEQYEDFIRKAAVQGAAYLRRKERRILFLDRMEEDDG